MADYCVVLSGRLREGETPEDVRARLAKLFRVKPEQLEPLFLKVPSVLRRGLDESTAARWVEAVEKTGALCWAEPDRPLVTGAGPNPIQPQQVTPPAPRPVESAPGPAVSPPAQPTLVPAAVPLSPTARARTRNDVVPFPKCPKCGRLPESIEDSFMRTGVCPQCGLIISKYADNFRAAEQGFWGRLGMMDDRDRHWAAFWQSRLWPSYWRAVWYLCCAIFALPAVFRVLDVTRNRDEAVVPNVVEMGLSGFLVVGLAAFAAVASFYCFAVYQRSRLSFLVHVACSAGICAVLAVVGGVVAFIAKTVSYLVRKVWLDNVVNPVRAFGFAGVAFFGVVLYLAFVLLPAEKHVWEYLDGPRYSATVKEARALAGSEFPRGKREDKYRYYAFVFVEPTRAVDPEFERVLSRLLPDFSPKSFDGRHGPDVNLLVFNAIAFRDDLAADGRISPETRLQLERTAAEWEQSRIDSAAQLVRALDTRSPIDPKDLHLLADRN